VTPQGNASHGAGTARHSRLPGLFLTELKIFKNLFLQQIYNSVSKPNFADEHPDPT
jgi:hypothetical protein